MMRRIVSCFYLTAKAVTKKFFYYKGMKSVTYIFVGENNLVSR